MTLVATRAVVLLALTLFVADATQGADEEPFYKQVTRAVVRLQIHRSVCVAGRQQSDETLEPAGSGFFVKDYLGPEPILWAVTARHVVTEAGADLLAKARLGADKPQDVWLQFPRGKWFFLDDGARPEAFPTDVAVMPLRQVAGYKSFTLCEGDRCPVQDPPKSGRVDNQLRDDPTVPDPVLLLGFPREGPDVGALEPFARAGIVAYGSPDARLKIGARPMFDRGAYVVDAFSWPGNSGGPVMSQPLPLSGGLRLLGLVTGSHLPFGDYSIVTPVSSIRRTLEAGRGKQLPAIDAWREAYKFQPRSSGGGEATSSNDQTQRTAPAQALQRRR